MVAVVDRSSMKLLQRTVKLTPLFLTTSSLYLHSTCLPPVSHSNLKAANTLLDEELMPRLSDCGLAVLRPLTSNSVKLKDMVKKAKRSYEKNRSAFKDARVSNVNAFVRQEDDQGIVNAEEGTGYMMCLECSMICRPGGIRYRTEKILSWSLASSVKGVFGP